MQLIVHQRAAVGFALEGRFGQGLVRDFNDEFAEAFEQIAVFQQQIGGALLLARRRRINFYIRASSVLGVHLRL